MGIPRCPSLEVRRFFDLATLLSLIQCFVFRGAGGLGLRAELMEKIWASSTDNGCITTFSYLVLKCLLGCGLWRCALKIGGTESRAPPKVLLRIKKWTDLGCANFDAVSAKCAAVIIDLSLVSVRKCLFNRKQHAADILCPIFVGQTFILTCDSRAFSIITLFDLFFSFN